MDFAEISKSLAEIEKEFGVSLSLVINSRHQPDGGVYLSVNTRHVYVTNMDGVRAAAAAHREPTPAEKLAKALTDLQAKYGAAAINEAILTIGQ